MLAIPFLVMFQTYFNRRELKEKLRIQRALQGHLDAWALKGHSVTRALQEH